MNRSWLRFHHVAAYLLILLAVSGFSNCEPKLTGRNASVQEAPSNPEADTNEIQAVVTPEMLAGSLKRSFSDSNEYATIANSNLFSPDRKAEEEDTQTETTPTPVQKISTELPDLRLVGTFSSPDNKSLAFIVDKKNKDNPNKALKYSVGDHIGDYEIKEIFTDRINLLKNTEVASLKLKPSDNPQKSMTDKGQKRGQGEPADKGTSGIPPRQRKNASDSGETRSQDAKQGRIPDKDSQGRANREKAEMYSVGSDFKAGGDFSTASDDEGERPISPPLTCGGG